MKVTLCWATGVITALSAAVTQADLIASDSFAVSAGGNDYVSFSSILGQNPTVGASGFNGPWGNPSTSAFVPVPGGLTHPLTPGETFDGRLLSFTSNGNPGSGGARSLSREIAYTPVDGTYYMSVLLNKSASTIRDDLLAGLGSSQSPETNIFQVDGTYIGFVDGGITFFSGPGPSLNQLVSAAQMRIDETYFALLQYDYNTSGSDTVTATIFDGSSSEVANQAFPGLNLDGRLGRFKVLTQDFGPTPAVDEWRFGTELSDVMVSEPTLRCDFDTDELCNIADIDALVTEIVAGTDDPLYDLTGDAEVTLEDVTDTELGWLRLAGEENLGPGLSYLPADITLDGFVEGLDFIEWNLSKFTPTGLWSLGDLNADGFTDGQDFILWNINKFMSSDIVSAVPEPAAGVLSCFVLILLGVARVRRGA